jgi:hypothetical protein
METQYEKHNIAGLICTCTADFSYCVAVCVSAVSCEYVRVTGLWQEAHCGGPRGRVPLMGTVGYEREVLGTDMSAWGLGWATWSGFLFREL